MIEQRTEIPVTTEWLFKKSRVSLTSTDFTVNPSGSATGSGCLKMHDNNCSYGLQDKIASINEYWWSALGNGNYEGDIYASNMPTDLRRGSSKGGCIIFVGTFYGDGNYETPVAMIVS